jgi:hypothetical protein
VNHRIFVFSGPTLGGKSWLLERAREACLLDEASIIRMDDIRKKYWKDKVLTSAEGVYRNELTRNELKKQLVIDRAPTVALEMPLLTRRNHQEPLVDTVKSAESYLAQIANEKGDAHPSMTLRIILLYSSLDEARRRMMERLRRDGTNTDVFDFNWAVRIWAQYELPNAYHPLYLNTSVGESALQEAWDFLSGVEPDPDLMRMRANEFQGIINDAKNRT